jgi:hypothetical protein
MEPTELTHDEYIAALRDLLSEDPVKIRAANRALYRCATGEHSHVEADLALAWAGRPNQ